MLLQQRLQQQAQDRLKCRIYIGSLQYDITEDQVRVPFSAFGTVTRVDMPRVCISLHLVIQGLCHDDLCLTCFVGDKHQQDPNSTRSKGFCFLEYATVESANNALASMNGFQFGGRCAVCISYSVYI